MMAPSEVLRRVAALNLPTEAMREVLNIIADIQSVDDARREKQRDRKRASRDRSVTVTGQVCDGHSVSPSSPPKKVSPITPSKNTPPPTPSGISDARGGFDRLVASFPKRKGRSPLKPARKSYEAALARGVDPAEIQAGAERFHRQAVEEKIVGTPYVPQLVTWVNQEGWRDAAAVEPAQSKALVFVADDSDAGRAWTEFEIRTQGRKGPRTNEGWWREVQWPPDHQGAAA